MNNTMNQDVLVRLSWGDCVPLIGRSPMSLPRWPRHRTAGFAFGDRALRARRPARFEEGAQ